MASLQVEKGEGSEHVFEVIYLATPARFVPESKQKGTQRLGKQLKPLTQGKNLIHHAKGGFDMQEPGQKEIWTFGLPRCLRGERVAGDWEKVVSKITSIFYHRIMHMGTLGR